MLSSQLCGCADTLSTMSPSALFDLYDGTLRRIVDEYLPVEEVSVRDRPLTPWFDNDCRAAKRKVWKDDTGALTQRWIVWPGSDSWNANGIYWSGKKKGTGMKRLPRTLGNPRSCGLFSTASNRKTEPTNLRRPMAFLPLSDFFRDKVEKVRDETSTADPPTFTKLTDASFVSFRDCFMEEVRRFLIQSPPKSCSLDPLPTFILREFMDELLPFIHIMCNISMQHGVLPESEKSAIVTPILKKYDLDPNNSWRRSRPSVCKSENTASNSQPPQRIWE